MTETLESTAPEPSRPPSTTHSEVFSSGKTVGDITLDTILGSGGMSVIFRGRVKKDLPDYKLRKQDDVVVKVLKPIHVGEEAITSRFKIGGEATKDLKHPNIAETYFVGEEQIGNEKVPYLVSRFVKGSDLSKLMLTNEQHAIVFRDILDALDYSHREDNGTPRVIHRDIKPANIMIGTGSVGNKVRAYLIDFDLVKVTLDSKEGETVAQIAPIGTLSYMSPEQADQFKNAGPLSDLYSLAATAYHMHSRVKPLESIADIEAEEELRSRILKHRTTEEVGFDLWLNDAIEYRRKKLNEFINDANPEKSKDPELKQKEIERAKKELEFITPVSEEYEDLWMSVLLAKDKEKRPSAESILTKLNTLIQENKVARYDLTSEQKEERKNKISELESRITQYEKETSSIKDPKDVETLNTNLELLTGLSKAQEELAETLPRSNSSRAIHINNAHDNLKKALSQTRILKDERYNELEKGLSKLDFKRFLEYRRDMHKRGHLLQKTVDGYVTAGIQAIGKKEYGIAAQNYVKITETQVPNDKKTFVDLFIQNIEGTIDQLLMTGKELLDDSKTEDAITHCKNAKILSDAINKEQVKKSVAKLYSGIKKSEIENYKSSYGDAKEMQDYNLMLDSLDNISRIIPDLIEEDQTQEKEFVEKGIDILRPYKGSISILRTFTETAESLNKELSDLIEKSGTTGLPSKEIDHYITQADEQIAAIKGSLKPEKVGEASYNHCIDILNTVREDAELQERAKNVMTDDVMSDIKTLYDLFTRYEKKGDAKTTAKYRGLLTQRLNDHAGESINTTSDKE